MTYDIIIVGGGMVGASLAAALRETPLKIALIDATPLAADDPRLIALNYTSYCLLKNLNVWDMLAPHAAAINKVHVSMRGHFGMTRLSAREANLPVLGYVVPAKYINAALNNVISQQNNITIFRPATLKKLQQTANGVEILITHNQKEQTLQSKILIGADGTHSTVRMQLNISATIHDHQQSALVTTTHLQHSHQHIAYERFHASGAIAMLPLAENLCATIWTDNTETIKELLQYDDTTFLAQLQQQFGYRLGTFLTTSTRHHYPLQTITATQLHFGKVLLLGNAAHTYHPIAAQGLNLALAEIAKLAECLAADYSALDWSAYLTWQSTRQTISSDLSQKLPWLFAQDFLPLQLLRSLAMLGLDIFPALKQRFVKKALGHTQVLPTLLQPQE